MARVTIDFDDSRFDDMDKHEAQELAGELLTQDMLYPNLPSISNAVVSVKTSAPA